MGPPVKEFLLARAKQLYGEKRLIAKDAKSMVGFLEIELKQTLTSLMTLVVPVNMSSNPSEIQDQKVLFYFEYDTIRVRLIQALLNEQSTL
jgi:hypothetical protein